MWHALRANTRSGSKKNIAYHYDLGNAFYTKWLDPTMAYSSAVFEPGAGDLEAAQHAKFRRMAEKLDIRPGQRVLEIGCGWGGFATYLARECQAKVTAITVSKEQLAHTQAKVQREGLGERVEARFVDYRDVDGRFDRIASIEMFEAVGEKYWPTYFDTLRDRLKPGKNATLQIITIADHRWELYRNTVDFIQKYIFPGGMLPAPKVLRAEVEKAGLRVKGSIEFGKSYSQTLRRWHETFNDRWDEVAKLGFDDRFRRMWNFYLTSCAGAFEGGNCDVTQITVTRPV